jgi:hypothetical protein
VGVERFDFLQIDDVESVFCVGPHVCNREEIPVLKALSIVISL